MKVAFVPPWYGARIPGGAEAAVRQTAEHLHQAGVPVEVLTTCARDLYSDWNRNHHRPGITVENGVVVRRFPVRQRNRDAFDAVNLKLMSGQAVLPDEEMIYVEENIRSLALEQYISDHANDYAFVFVPYMFGTTYWGLRACKDNAFLIPCLHNEAYARMRVFRDMFQRVKLNILHAEAERRLLVTLYNLSPERSVVVGIGIDTDWTTNPAAFLSRYGLSKPFILYAGRKESGKNVDTLVQYFRRYRRSRTGDVDLVLIGSGSLEQKITRGDGIYDLGFVSVTDKHNAYGAATVLCQPSLHESFSLVIMEAWQAGTPVLVHGNCEVTKEHCIRSNGGLYFTNYDEFAICLDLLLENGRLRSALAANGRQYVLDNYQWEVVIQRYQELLGSWGVI